MPIYESSLGAATTLDPGDSDVPPPVPPRDEKPQFKKGYVMKSPTATILMYRQSEQNAPAIISSAADVFLNEELDLSERLEKAQVDDGFWLEFAKNYDGEYVREHSPRDIEEKVLQGVPGELRCPIYFRVLNIKSIVERHTYESLVKKAKLASFEEGTETGAVLSDHSELVQVYWHCLKRSSSQTTGVLSEKVVENLAHVLQLIQDISKMEALAILFRLTEIFAHFSSSEFSYKASRALEDLAGAQFLHVTKQGIDLGAWCKTAVGRILDVSAGETVPLQTLDLVLLEGVDFLIRVLCAIFLEQGGRILSLDGDALDAYLHSGEFFAIQKNTLQRSVGVEFSIVKYENEFSLMNANSISGNDNEVRNLSETQQQLESKLAALREKYAQLQKTHEEIHSQNAEYASKLAEARTEKEALLQRKEALQQRYNQLTMQENLSNTIKANRDISRENEDLEAQIGALRKKVEAKEKMIK